MATKKKEQTVTQLARKLRAVLPGNVVKARDEDTVAYIIDEQVGVAIHYHCSWSIGEKKPTQNQCHPAYITVRLAGTYLEDRKYRPNTNMVFRVQTFRPNKSGEFALDKVLVAITKAKIATTNYIVRADERAKKEEAKRKALSDKMKDLGKALPKSFKLLRNECGYKDTQNSNEDGTFVSVSEREDLEDENDNKETPIEWDYSIQASGLSKEDLLAVVEVLESGKRIKKAAG